MRPSDVPTYVEHGVRRHRHHRQGRAARAVAAQGLRAARPRLRALPDGRGGRRRRRPDRRALRRLGRVRIATKYPRVAATHFAETGRQAEIVEVKGSVELAPLTGLVGRHRRPDGHRQDARGEPPRACVEEIGACTARLIANPVAHKLKAAADRRDRGADAADEDHRARARVGRSDAASSLPGGGRGARDHRGGARGRRRRGARV